MELGTVPHQQHARQPHHHQHQHPHKSASDSRVASHAAAAIQAQQQQRPGLGQQQQQPPPSGSEGDGNDPTAGQQQDEEYEALKYGASHVIHLFVPVSICMAVVIVTVASIEFYSENDGLYLPYTPFHSDTDNAGTIFAESIGNALILLGVVVVMTIGIVLLYYYRFYKVIHGWLIVTTFMFLTILSFPFFFHLFTTYNIPLDYPTMFFFLWNWSAAGMFCIHWKGPLLVQQFYLIYISALMALIFIKCMPEWTVWTVLAVLSIWDLVAVLSPKGPLRILVETTQERNESILPALIYSSTILYSYITMVGLGADNSINSGVGDGQNEQQQNQPNDDVQQPDQQNEEDVVVEGDMLSTADAGDPGPASSSSSTTVHQRRGRSAGTSDDSANTLLTTVLTSSGGTESRTQTMLSSSSAAGHTRTTRSRSPRHPASERAMPVSTPEAEANNGDGTTTEERGVKLGLGDFIFYSVLVGKASSFGDWNVTIACYVAILVGLAFTLMLLALFRKALPALPISVFFGITFFFATHWLITPFLAQLSVRQFLL